MSSFYLMPKVKVCNKKAASDDWVLLTLHTCRLEASSASENLAQAIWGNAALSSTEKWSLVPNSSRDESGLCLLIFADSDALRSYKQHAFFVLTRGSYSNVEMRYFCCLMFAGSDVMRFWNAIYEFCDRCEILYFLPINTKQSNKVHAVSATHLPIQYVNLVPITESPNGSTWFRFVFPNRSDSWVDLGMWIWWTDWPRCFNWKQKV